MEPGTLRFNVPGFILDLRRKTGQTDTREMESANNLKYNTTRIKAGLRCDI